MRGSRARAIAAALTALAAILYQRAATTAWGHAEVNGVPVTLSAVGLSRDPGSDCRWWPAYGDGTLCGVRSGGEASMQQLKAAYPTLQAALWVAIIALFLISLRIPASAAVRAGICALAGALGGAGAYLVLAIAPRALAVFSASRLSADGAGVFLAGAASLSCLLAALLELSGSRPTGTA